MTITVPNSISFSFPSTKHPQNKKLNKNKIQILKVLIGFDSELRRRFLLTEMELMAALKLGPRSVPIIGDDLETNRTRDGAATTTTAAAAGLSSSSSYATAAIAVVDNQIVVVAQAHTSTAKSGNPNRRRGYFIEVKNYRKRESLRRRESYLTMKGRRQVRELGGLVWFLFSERRRCVRDGTSGMRNERK